MSGFVDLPIRTTAIATDLIVPYSGAVVHIASAAFAGAVLCSCPVTISDTTQSFGETSGALIVAGGVGIGKDTHVKGQLHALSNVDSDAPTTGAVVVVGGVGIGKNVHVQGQLHIVNGTDSGSTTTGALVVSGGAGIGQQLYVGGFVHITDGTVSNSTTSGALVVTGGIGTAGALYAGSDSRFLSNTDASSTSTGALAVPNGGVGIGQQLYVGGVTHANSGVFLGMAASPAGYVPSALAHNMADRTYTAVLGGAFTGTADAPFAFSRVGRSILVHFVYFSRLSTSSDTIFINMPAGLQTVLAGYSSISEEAWFPIYCSWGAPPVITQCIGIASIPGIVILNPLDPASKFPDATGITVRAFSYSVYAVNP
jgi:hypothetical protein